MGRVPSRRVRILSRGRSRLLNGVVAASHVDERWAWACSPRYSLPHHQASTSGPQRCHGVAHLQDASRAQPGRGTHEEAHAVRSTVERVVPSARQVGSGFHPALPCGDFFTGVTINRTFDITDNMGIGAYSIAAEPSGSVTVIVNAGSSDTHVDARHHRAAALRVCGSPLRVGSRHRPLRDVVARRFDRRVLPPRGSDSTASSSASSA